ncbi:MAG TPA: hypothetical protein VI583_16690 [Cyclobacteriaceae bacterium]|nr:hypothetical protein [Cyclobacteriaceae bacterium]
MFLSSMHIKINRRCFAGFIAQAALMMGCTPVRLILSGINKNQRSAETIRAFMEAIVPGVQISEGETACFFDPAYPFQPVASIFISDLNEAASQFHPGKKFSGLEMPERQALIQKKLRKPLVNRLYFMAIWFTQIIVYAGMAKPGNKCSFIGFEGETPTGSISYSNPVDYIGRSLTSNGNINL